MKLRSQQLSLRTLLLSVAFVAGWIAAYRFDPSLPALLTIVVAALIGGAAQLKRSGTGAAGALAGGSVGGALTNFVYLIIRFTLEPNFEYEGLGFLGCVMIACSIGAVWGAAIGCLTWAFICGLLRYVHPALARLRNSFNPPDRIGSKSNAAAQSESGIVRIPAE